MKTLLIALSLIFVSNIGFAQQTPMQKAKAVKKLSNKINTLTKAQERLIQKNQDLVNEINQLKFDAQLDEQANNSLSQALKNKSKEVEFLKEELKVKNRQIDNLIQSNKTLIDQNQNLNRKVENLVELKNQSIVALKETRVILRETEKFISSSSGGANSLMLSGLAGILTTKSCTHFSGDASIDWLINNNKTISLGLGVGTSNYTGISSFPFFVTSKFFLNEDGLNNLDDRFAFSYLVLRAGYTIIKEKFEIIDNFSSSGLYFTGGFGLLMPITKNFSFAAEVNYKLQGLKELSKNQEFISSNKHSINGQVGIVLFLN